MEFVTKPSKAKEGGRSCEGSALESWDVFIASGSLADFTFSSLERETRERNSRIETVQERGRERERESRAAQARF